DTVLNISDGAGACFGLQRGTEVTIRNFRLIGHTGLAEQPGVVRTSSGFNFWACALKSCNAVSINATERVLVENVHASRMASECFFSGGPYRQGKEEPKEYTRSATFLRCSVTDCAANAFNNCDFAENTSILYCRVDGAGAGWHAYEGSGRFVRFIGNYVRNAGPVTIGDIPHSLPRLDHFQELGVGQAIVADNVFEGIGRCGGIRVNHCPTQVVIANNLFINYNGYAIATSNATVHNTYPPQNISITGNIIDLTYAGENPAWRGGIIVNTSDTLVSNNQVYVRGAPDAKVTGVQIRDGALNVNVHGNLVRNCGRGLVAHRLPGKVAEVVDSRTFLQTGLPLEWRTSHLYRNWTLAWLKDSKPAGQSVVDAYDPATLRFKLREPHEMRADDSFEAFPPSANWNIHGNTLTGCVQPVLLDSYGSETSFFKDNVVTRSEATGVKSAIEVRGRFNLIGNHVSGFDESGCSALTLHPDRFGKPMESVYRDNVFERCANVVNESVKGLWEASNQGNTTIRCGSTAAE
ncbi:MAG: right-handed parallel beta-helix repeat-containing protein, partial [Planctomycetes bacterium]|nr:right-handed parallel beta-helix repeat-containing protein [Planctomycetota bacterium]